MSELFATNGRKGKGMEGLKRGWRVVLAGGLLGVLAAGTASSHVSVVERELRGQAFLRETSVLKGVERRIQLADGGQLSLTAGGDTLVWTDREAGARSYPLTQPRINASLTLLPSGRVLVWGGTDVTGEVQKGGLWFHPDKGQWEQATDLTPVPRAGHTATVLGDGRVLFAGGLDRRPAELWDERVNRAVALSADTVLPRLGHRAELQSDGSVRISGGHGLAGSSASRDATFDLLAGTFRDAGEKPRGAGAGIAQSWPAQGAGEVMPDARLSVLFADRLRMPDLSESHVSLVGPGGAARIRVSAAEGGRLVFVQPAQALFPASKYTLMIDRVRAQSGRILPLMAVDFTTAALDSQGRRLPIPIESGAVDRDNRVTGSGESCHQGDALLPCRERGIVEDAVWSPGRDNTDNRWRLYDKSLEADTSPRIAHLARLYGLTIVRGRIVRIDQKPVAGVEVSIGRSVAFTDDDGRFNLFDVPAGQQELYVDGSSANRGADEYGQFVVGVEVKPKQLNELPYLMHLPKVAARDKIRIASPLQKDLVVGHPDIPGLELHIPKGTVIHDRKGRLVTELAIVPTPVNRAPFPVMENHPMAFTVEPGAAQIRGLSPTAHNGIRVYYPNYDGYGAGTEANFWIYDPTEGWRVYGKGTVSADGRHVVPEKGVALHQTMGGMYSVPGSNAATERYAQRQCGKCAGSGAGSGGVANAGDPIDLYTGQFVHSQTDIAIADSVPLLIDRSYRPNDLRRREFGIGMSWNWGYTLNRPGSTYDVLELIQPNGTAVRFDRISGQNNHGVWRQTGSDTQFSGAILRTVYDSDPTQPWGRAFRLSLADGGQMQFSSWNDIRLRWIEDRHGNRTTLVYNAGLISRIVSPSGRYLDIGYDSNNRIQTIHDHTGRRWGYAYNARGLLADVTYPNDTVQRYEYQVDGVTDVTRHRIQAIFDRRGNRVLFNEFEIVGGQATGRVVRQTLADNSTVSIDYAHLDNGVTGTLVTEADGSKRRIVFDAAGPYPKSETLAYGTSLAQTYRYERDAYSQLTATVDPLSRRSEITYDTEGRIERVTALAGTAEARSVLMSYHPDGRLAVVTDPLNRKTSFDYAGPCLTKTTSALGKSAAFRCNAVGQILSATDPLQHTTYFEYDGNELVKVTDHLGRHIDYSYDALGRLISSRDMEGNVVRTQYDVMDRVAKVFDAYGRPIAEYGYDNNDNLLAIQLANGNGVIYTYDKRDRLERRTDALDQGESWAYYPGGRIKTFTDRKEQSTHFAYDALGRPSVTTYHDGSTATATYDAGDRLRSVVDTVAGDLNWDYDDFDQLTREVSAQGQVTYDYDTVGRRREMTAAGQAKVEYLFDDGDRLRRITQGSEVVSFDYDDADRVTQTTLPNGIKAGYAYNDTNQLTGIAWLKPGNTPVGDLGYGYDAIGRLVAQTGSFASQTLPAASSGTNAFDDNNRQIQRQGQALSYDSNGNLIGDGVRTYVWNVRDQLTEIREGGAVVASFQYDAGGRRVARTEGGVTTAYLYDGVDAVQETQGAVTNPILTGLGTDQRFARNEASGRAYFLTDHLGSTRALTNASGAVVQRYDYTAYGEVTPSASGFSNPYQYTGREQDANGLMYYRARYYAPAQARFISEDSYGFGAGDPNFYAYVGGAPMSASDPTGHLAFLIPVVIAVVELGLIAYSAYHAGRVVMDDCASTGAKILALGMLAASPIGGVLLGRLVGKVLRAFVRPAKTAPKNSFSINDREGDIIIGTFKGTAGEGQVIGTMIREGDTLILRGVHIDGRATLREALAVAREFGREQGVKRVIIEGGSRTTGARPGHAPRPLTVETGL